MGSLKEALKHASSHEDQVLLRAALVHLQDQDTISHVLCGFSSSHTANERGAMAEVFRLAKAPATIPFLVDYIYLDDRDEHILRDAIGVGRKDYIAARLVADLLANCPEFKASTRASAREVKGLTSREIRERIRAWWPENRSYFERKDYKSVEPLETEMPRGVVR